MDLFRLLRITWLPGQKNARTAVPPRDRSPSAPEAGLPAGPPEPPEAGSPAEPPEPQEPTAVTLPAAAAEPDLVQSLIRLADDLAELSDRDWTGESAARTLRLVKWRVDKVLAECGVQVLFDEGPVMPTRHEVVGAEPAGPDGRAGWIAVTVRRGYLLGDQLIRPQQVIAYVTNEPAAHVEGNNHAERG
jgi:hypothetical protein